MKKLLEIIERVEKARLATDRHRIVKIVAVSKYTDTNAIRSLYAAGQRAFGESRVQDLQAKHDELNELPIEWHFVGRLQSNKINALLELQPALIHSLDSFKLAEALDKRAEAKDVTINALLQINSAKEESKAGFEPEAAIEAYERVSEECHYVNLQGLMSIGAHSEDRDVVQKSFETSREIFDKLGDKASVLSMGMSGDFELAIACGSNMLRLGSILF